MVFVRSAQLTLFIALIIIIMCIFAFNSTDRSTSSLVLDNESRRITNDTLWEIKSNDHCIRTKTAQIRRKGAKELQKYKVSGG